MVSISNRTKARLMASIVIASLVGALAGCSGEQRETVRFAFSKREAIPFMEQTVADYNASQNQVVVELDTSGIDVVAASFVRGNPPDILLANYNFEIARFVERCTLSDLSDTTAAEFRREDLEPLMDQYGKCEGRISALPYSLMAASVIYNKTIFDQYDIEIPETWDELIQVAETLKSEGITPFYGTFKDDWTVGQGWYDYSLGGMVDVVKFFDELENEGTQVGANAPYSFQKDFAEPLEKMQLLAKNYTNADAASRSYADGNLAFAQGNAAMYLQGPWAFSEIAKTVPDLELGTFPLPMTNDPADLAVRVNIDLAVLIPEASRHQEAARNFMEYLYQPEVIENYNESQFGFTPTKDAPPPTDPRIVGMIPYYEEARIYQGPSVLVPRVIPVPNYAQAMILGGDTQYYLSTMDDDWARLAFRHPNAEKEPQQ